MLHNLSCFQPETRVELITVYKWGLYTIDMMKISTKQPVLMGLSLIIHDFDYWSSNCSIELSGNDAIPAPLKTVVSCVWNPCQINQITWNQPTCRYIKKGYNYLKFLKNLWLRWLFISIHQLSIKKEKNIWASVNYFAWDGLKHVSTISDMES